jgi:hypothetical protein
MDGTDGRTLTLGAGDLHRIREALERTETAYATAADLEDTADAEPGDVARLRDLAQQYGTLAERIRALLPTDPDDADRLTATLTTSTTAADATATSTGQGR